MTPPKIATRAVVVPQRVAVVSRVTPSQPTRVLDVHHAWQQLSLFGRPAGALSGPSRTD